MAATLRDAADAAPKIAPGNFVFFDAYTLPSPCCLRQSGCRASYCFADLRYKE
jgi:hypothetical protein